MVYAFCVCQWVFKILPHIFWMRFYLRTWCISMISFFWEMPMLLWHSIFMCNSLTFLFHMDNTSFFLPISFGKFQQESYANIWGHYRSKIMGVFSRPFTKCQAWLSISFGGICLSLWRIVPHLFFWGIGFWWLFICDLSFVSLIDPFWKNMFFRLKNAHTYFNHAYV